MQNATYFLTEGLLNLNGLVVMISNRSAQILLSPPISDQSQSHLCSKSVQFQYIKRAMHVTSLLILFITARVIKLYNELTCPKYSAGRN